MSRSERMVMVLVAAALLAAPAAASAQAGDGEEPAPAPADGATPVADAPDADAAGTGAESADGVMATEAGDGEGAAPESHAPPGAQLADTAAGAEPSEEELGGPEETAGVDCSRCTALGTFPPVGTGKPWWEWIRMRTGETFGGDLRGVHDGNLVIKSDEVDELTLNFAWVWEFYFPEPVTVITIDHIAHSGPAEMLDNENVIIHTVNGDVSILKSNVLSINTGDGTELDNWYFKAGLGLNLTSATVSQASLSEYIRITRDDEYTRLTLNHDLSFGRTEDAMGVETISANNTWALAKFDIFLSQLFYVTAANVTLGYDKLQNVGFRVTPGAGVGVHILDGGPDLDLELGGNYQYTSFDNVAAGADTDAQGGGGTYRVYFDWNIVAGWLGLTLEHRGFIVYSDVAGASTSFSQSTFRTSGILDIDLWTYIDLDISATWDRVLEPAPLADGTTPQADTVTLVVGLSVEIGG